MLTWLILIQVCRLSQICEAGHLYCFLAPSDVSTWVPISACRLSYHSHFSRHSHTTIIPLDARGGAIFTPEKLDPNQNFWSLFPHNLWLLITSTQYNRIDGNNGKQ